MTYIASILYYTHSTGSEMEVLVGESLEDINEAFEIFQNDIKHKDTLEEVNQVVLTAIDTRGQIVYSKKVQTKTVVVITDIEDDS